MTELFAGRYELVDRLGFGGMGTVWRAWDHRGGRGPVAGQPRPPGFVAVKLLHRSDANSLLRFVREQAFRIEHPHVVTPLGWAAEDDRVLFSMPLVAGGSLATLRSDFGVLPPVWVATLLDQLLAGLEAVHAARVVHRDLKPANLLLEPTGRQRPHLRLSDFGIASAIGEPRLTATSNVIGTPGYLAPEQLRGAAPDPQQDLYAAGVVAAELLLGREDEKAVPEISGPPPDGIPEGLWSVLLRLTAEQPEDRPAGAGDARLELNSTGWAPGPTDVFPPPGDEAGVEVFNHLPALPDGWRPGGAMVAGGPAPGPIVAPPPGPVTRPMGGPLPPTRAVGEPGGTRSMPAGVSVAAPGRFDGTDPSPVPGSQPAKGRSAAANAARRRSTTRTVVGALAGLAMLGGLALMATAVVLFLQR